MRSRWIHLAAIGLTSFTLIVPISWARDEARPWVRSHEFDEVSFTQTNADKVRIYVNAPVDDKGNPVRATRIVVYTLPAGNTIEQTLGCKMKPGLDWHYDIQHVAAQIRLLRSLIPNERIVLVCPEGPGLSWSAFRKAHPDADSRMAELVEQWRKEFGNEDTHVMLTGHSNGGSFMFGVIDGTAEIPAYIDRIAFLDANYNFDAKKHAEKIERWLKGNDARRLIVVAYDDREITYNGKKVNPPTGGTYRATGRMRDAFGTVFPLTDASSPPFEKSIGLKGRLVFFVHPNPENKILHTVLVGDMNGLVSVATLGTSKEKSVPFAKPRAYTKYVQAEPTPGGPPAKPVATTSAKAVTTPMPSDAVKTFDRHLPSKPQPQLPPQSKSAISGSEFIKSVASVSKQDREAAIEREILAGNFPNFLREFKSVPLVGTMKPGGKEISTTLEVMPDYLSVGSDTDFVRMPMTPQTAQHIADEFGCTLPTRKLVDAIDKFAEIHVAPRPMTKDRELVGTFLEHNRLVEQQRGKNPLGLLLIGDKKDIVLTPRIYEKPNRVAIYGWRQLNDQPIQPLTTVHVNHYVDYSHGVRLVLDKLNIGGKTVKISKLLADPDGSSLVSDEGPMTPPRYPDK